MRTRFFVVPALAMGIATTAFAAPMFEVTHVGMSQQRGFLTNASGKVTLDRAARSGSIDTTIGTGSVVTASRLLTDVLKRDDYFNAGKFPVMTFSSRDLVFDRDFPIGANGELTLLGVMRPVALNMQDCPID
jgi:polyisoprenoid-binding protein YceI